MIGWYEDLHLGKSLMAFHASVKGSNAILKRWDVIQEEEEAYSGRIV